MPRSPFESLPACSGMVQRRANAKPCSLSHRRGRGVWFVWFISRIFENYNRTMTVSLVLGFTSRTISFDLLQLAWRRGEMAFCSQCLRRWSQLCDLEADVATLPTQPRKRLQRSPTFLWTTVWHGKLFSLHVDQTSSRWRLCFFYWRQVMTRTPMASHGFRMSDWFDWSDRSLDTLCDYSSCASPFWPGR